MKISIEEISNLSFEVLKKLGFNDQESKDCLENMLEGEITGKKTHGFVRLKYLSKAISENEITVGDKDINIEKETAVSVLINGNNKVGLHVVRRALEIGIEKVKESGMVMVGCTKTAPISGLIGLFARKSTEKDLIFIGFNNSSGGLIPYGATKEMLGTNPVTVGIPTNSDPVILDMASSQITWGDLLVAKQENKNISENVALDEEGNVTTDPTKAMGGGLLPFAGHKGSGLAFIVELLGGALTKSRVGSNVEGGWGSLFILIDPTILRPLKDFKSDVESAIKELKSLPHQNGFTEIYYPGEQSNRNRSEAIQSGFVDISDGLLEDIRKM
jgi:L-2-hydroxycarboxylate dehydrogenase (NAD+)